ncbi:MAG: 4-hydroxy-tetrahydrodipicolinate reductase [Gaiellales bacterium]|jgi:4-hydroxy-tetrahydrodipicolinate reductase|nr:4-hydroxy-tetrahydrodipicolinate reductase [Gaiellales bacterium]
MAIRVVVSGATGKVGQALLPAIQADPDLELAGTASPTLGRTLAEALSAGEADVVVDFTAPDFAREACEQAIAARTPIVLGTTGLGPDQLEALGADAAAQGVQLFYAPNFAIGAVLMMRFAEEASRHLAGAEIVELHAVTKRDAPSGTARATAERMEGDVPIHSVRLPGLVAHQEVILGGLGETLTIRHDTTSRDAFAPGVLLAVKRVASLPPGLTIGLEAVL